MPTSRSQAHWNPLTGLATRRAAGWDPHGAGSPRLGGRARLGWLAAALALWAAPVLAQQTQGGGTTGEGGGGGGQAQGSLLPEIDPQDIEIRSQYSARFPGVTRQPILGFNPRPRVYRVDPNRIPYMETREEVIVNLPLGSLSRPIPPPYTPYERPAVRRGRVEGGLGTLVSPVASAWVSVPMGQSLRKGLVRDDSTALTWFDLSVDGRLLESFDANPDGTVREGRLSMAWTRPSDVRSGFEARVDAFHVENGMLVPDYRTGVGLPPNVVPGGGAGPVHRSYGVEMVAEVSGPEQSFETWNTVLALSGTRLELADAPAQVAARAEAISADIHHSRSWLGARPLDVYTGGLSAGYRLVGPVDGGFQEFQTAYLKGDITLERIVQDRIPASTRLTAMLLQIQNGVTLLPGLETAFTIPLLPRLSLRSNLKAEAEPFSMREAMARNPYLRPDAAMRHTYALTTFSELTLTLLRGTELRGGARYRLAHNELSFTRRTSPTLGGVPQADFFTTSHIRASILDFYGSVTQPFFAERVGFSLEGWYRLPYRIEGGRIPYEESLGGSGTISVRVHRSVRWTVTGDYVGSRKTSSGGDLDAYFVMSSDLRFLSEKGFGIFARAVNLLGTDYTLWDGVPERPIEGFFGLTLDF